MPAPDQPRAFAHTLACTAASHAPKRLCRCTQGKAAPNYNDSALDAAEKSTGAKRRRTFDTLVGEHGPQVA